MVAICKGYWSVKDTQANPHKLWIFGDNVIGCGKKVKPASRMKSILLEYPPNCPTSLKEDTFFSDDDFGGVVEMIDARIADIHAALPQYGCGIVLPEYCLGTGLTQLDKKASKIFKYLCDAIEQLKIDCSSHS